MSELLLVFLSDLRMIIKKRNGVKEQIVKIESLVRFEILLIF
jgi:hypothetical protein